LTELASSGGGFAAERVVVNDANDVDDDDDDLERSLDFEYEVCTVTLFAV